MKTISRFVNGELKFFHVRWRFTHAFRSRWFYFLWNPVHYDRAARFFRILWWLRIETPCEFQADIVDIINKTYAKILEKDDRYPNKWTPLRRAERERSE